MGHQLETIFHLQWKERTGYELQYDVPNIFGSFTAGQLNFINTDDRGQIKAGVRKDFISPEIKYGGGLEYERYDGPDTVYGLPDSSEVDIGFTSFGGWMGRSIKVGASAASKNPNKNIILAIGASTLRYHERPELRRDSNLQYQNNSFWIVSLTYTQRDYFKDNYIFGFGKAEDIPKGIRLELTAGYEREELAERFYLGASVAHAHFLSNLGYLSNSYSVGTYLLGGHFEQSMVEASSTYFTKLYGSRKGFRQRSFVHLNGVLGYKRRANEVVSISDEAGIRGLKSEGLLGYSSFVVRYSHLLFTPWKPIGFQVAFGGFFDIGYVAEQAHELFSGRPYTGLGIELQVNNEDLVFGTLRLRLAFYPAAPPDASSFSLGGGGARSSAFSDFAARPPAVLAYGR